MEGTSTWGIRLTDHFIGEDQLIADPAGPFVNRVRAAFILLQVGMATGLVQASLDAMNEVEPVLGHVSQFLHDRPDVLQAEFAELNSRVAALVRTPPKPIRTSCSTCSMRAYKAPSWPCVRPVGPASPRRAGYLMSAGPQRRIREAQFVAIVTPAIKHLRYQMNRLMQEAQPA